MGIISHFTDEITFAFTTTFRLTILVIKIKTRKRRWCDPLLCHAPSLGMPDTYICIRRNKLKRIFYTVHFDPIKLDRWTLQPKDFLYLFFQFLEN